MFRPVLAEPYLAGLWNLGFTVAVAIIGVAVVPLLRRWKAAYSDLAKAYWSAYAVIVFGMLATAIGFLSLGIGLAPIIATVLTVTASVVKLIGLIMVILFLSKMSKA